MYLSHLKSLQELHASETLTEEEFIEQKKYALQGIKGLNVNDKWLKWYVHELGDT